MANYKLDTTHSSVSFFVKHMMIAKVHGSFEKLSGELTYEAANPESATAFASIEAASINTREPQRDAHLRSADFFDVESFPAITFKSTSVIKLNDEEIKVTGDLTIKGITKQIVLNVEGPSAELKDPYGNLKIGLSAQTKIKRKEFGLNWNAALEAGGVLVGEEVTILLDLQFAKQS